MTAALIQPTVTLGRTAALVAGPVTTVAVRRGDSGGGDRGDSGGGNGGSGGGRFFRYRVGWGVSQTGQVGAHHVVVVLAAAFVAVFHPDGPGLTAELDGRCGEKTVNSQGILGTLNHERYKEMD